MGNFCDGEGETTVQYTKAGQQTSKGPYDTTWTSQQTISSEKSMKKLCIYWILQDKILRRWLPCEKRLEEENSGDSLQ
jgi:hypothetical protein